MIRIILADDHDIVRAGLRRILESQGDLSVVAEAATGNETLDICATTGADVIVLDLDMPGIGGLELIPRIKQARPALKILVLTMFDNTDYAIRALRMGASGYALKASSSADLPNAVRKIFDGGTYLCPATMEKVAMAKMSPGEPALDLLSEREYQILKRIAADSPPSEIAADLNLSLSTIYTYKKRIMNKLGLNNNADIVRFTMKHQGIEKA